MQGDVSLLSAEKVLEELEEKIRTCRKCKLCEYRQNAVPGEGGLRAKVMFVGEAPGEEEDAQGRPFVGRAGQLLRKLIEHIELEEGEYYIANVLKCRPPGNRNPEPIEIEACKPYLIAQIGLIKPLLIVPLGNFALQVLVGSKLTITRSRGKLISRNGICFFPTYHPAAVLRGSARLKDELIRDFEKIPILLQELLP